MQFLTSWVLLDILILCINHSQLLLSYPTESEFYQYLLPLYFFLLITYLLLVDCIKGLYSAINMSCYRHTQLRLIILKVMGPACA